jgi:hypothetical protein
MSRRDFMKNIEKLYHINEFNSERYEAIELNNDKFK